MRWFCFSVWPAVWLFETCVMTMMAWSERRWRPRMDPASQGGSDRVARTSRPRRLGQGVAVDRRTARRASFSARRGSPAAACREIMLPAEHISMLDVNASLNACLVTAHLEMHTRFPVAERPGDPESILGYVNFKDLVALMRLSQPHEASLRSILRPLPSLRDDMLLAACLERLIREHTHIALVRDAAGKVVGLITLEDVLEEFVGEIQDEYDRLPIHAMPSGRAWVVGGGLSLARLKELTGIDLAADPPTDASRRRLADRQRLGRRPHARAFPQRRRLRSRRRARRRAQGAAPEGLRGPDREGRRAADLAACPQGCVSRRPARRRPLEGKTRKPVAPPKCFATGASGCVMC